MRHNPAAISLFLMLAGSFVLSGCTTTRMHDGVITRHAVIPALETPKPVIPAVVKVKVTDPGVRRFMSVTDHIELSALGKLKPGTFKVNGRSITIKPNTDFKLNISLPVDNPTVLSTERATGTLWTSEEVLFIGMPLPKSIEIKNGKATSNVDLLRLLSGYFINVLDSQSESAKNAELRNILDVLVIKSAVMQLTPGAYLQLQKKKLHVGRGSRVEMRDVVVDGDLNYKGTFITHLNFLKDNDWIGEKVDVLFNGGSANLNLAARRIKGNVELRLQQNKSAQVVLDDCLFKFGKSKRSSAHVASATLTPTRLVWAKPEGAEKSSMHLDTPMNLSNTTVCVKTDTTQTDAKFPGVAASQLKVDIDPPARSNSFTTLKTETAAFVTVAINRPKTKLKLDVTDAKVDRIGWTKHGDLDFKLSKGISKLKQVTWTTGDKTFALASNGNSTLELPQGMRMNLSADKSENEMNLPMVVRMSAGTLNGTSGKLAVSNLNGKMLITVNPETRITSDMDLTIDESHFLGDERMIVKAHGLNVGNEKGKSAATAENVSVTVSQEALKEAIIKRIPTEKIFQLNKVIGDKKWRYQNFKVETVRVTNVVIDSMNLKDTNTFEFTLRGDVEGEGSVEKGGLLSVLKSDMNNAEVKPWSAKAHVAGTGTVTCEMIENNSLGESELQYKVSLELPVRENIELDWSRVNDGLFKNTEKKAIVNSLKETDVPIKFAGRVKAFAQTSEKWRNMRVTGLTVVPSASGAELRFQAETIL